MSVCCTFCLKSQDQVEHLFTMGNARFNREGVESGQPRVEWIRPQEAPAPYICNVCADLAVEAFKVYQEEE